MVEMNTHRMSSVNSPSCGTRLDAATNVTSTQRPDPGDLTVCLRCGHLLAFDEQLKLRELNDAEIREAAGDRRLLAIQRVRTLVLEKRDSPDAPPP